MSWASAAAFVASAAIVVTYLRLARTGRPLYFHGANALGAVPIGVSEVYARAWPALALTAFFGVAGWYGLWREWCHDCGG